MQREGSSSSGRTLAGSVVSTDGVTFVAAATESWNRVGTVVMTTTVEQRAFVNI